MNAPKSRPGFPARLPVAGPTPGRALHKSLVTPAPNRPAAPAGVSTRKSSITTVPVSHGLDSQAVRQAMVRKMAAQGISHPQVLAAMGAVERHRFVDSALVNQAYEDTSLPIGLGQTISKPSVVARMLELLLQAPSLPAGQRLGRVLEIGTGCGYQAAVLSQLATEVYSMERLRGLHEKARDNLRPLRVPNLHLLFGDGMAGYPAGAPYAAIIAAAGGEAIPRAWTDQLALGGRLVAPASLQTGAQHLIVIDRTAYGLQQTVLEPVRFVPLKSGVV